LAIHVFFTDRVVSGPGHSYPREYRCI
jgi:hypothetical protein